jgi:hypothetical protein
MFQFSRLLAIALGVFVMGAGITAVAQDAESKGVEAAFSDSPLVRTEADKVAADILAVVAPMKVPHWIRLLAYPEDPLEQHICRLLGGVIYDIRVAESRGDATPDDVRMGVQFCPYHGTDQTLGKCTRNLERWALRHGTRIELVFVDSEAYQVIRPAADASKDEQAAAVLHNADVMRRQQLIADIVREFLPNAELIFWDMGHRRTGHQNGFEIVASPYFDGPVPGAIPSCTMWTIWEPQLMRDVVDATVANWPVEERGLSVNVSLGWGLRRTADGLKYDDYAYPLMYSYQMCQYLIHHPHIRHVKLYPHPIGRDPGVHPEWLVHLAAYWCGRHGWIDDFRRLEAAYNGTSDQPTRSDAPETSLPPQLSIEGVTNVKIQNVVGTGGDRHCSASVFRAARIWAWDRRPGMEAILCPEA